MVSMGTVLCTVVHRSVVSSNYPAVAFGPVAGVGALNAGLQTVSVGA